MSSTPRVHLLLTGNELMSGVTVDSNSARIAQLLEPLHLQVSAKVTIGDDMERLCAELDRLAGLCEVLVVNGGLGPTTDDLTAEALARVCGVPLEWNAESLAHIEQWCRARGIESNEANRKQGYLPAGCTLIANEIGSAVGFRMTHRGCEILCTPGVPSELTLMMEREIVPWLRARFPSSDEVVITRLQLFGVGESSVQQIITEACPDWPSHIELGFRAGAPTLEVKISSFRAEHAADRIACERRVTALLGDYLFGSGDTNLQRSLVALLAQRGLRIAAAESCTGGLIAAMITEVPGASAVFEAGYVTYSNRVKTQALGVRESTLAAHGAVSEATVLEMVRGCAERSGADLAVAVTGIAGPDGGSPEKPVGTVWIGWGGNGRFRAQQLYYPFGRKMFQTLVAATALDLLRREVLGLVEPPRYFRERALRR